MRTLLFLLGALSVAAAVGLLACGDDAPPVAPGGADAAVESSTPSNGDAAATDSATGERRTSAGTCGAASFSARWGGSLEDGLASAGETAAALALDGAGNLYLTGWFRGDADFGTGPVDAGGTNPSLVVMKRGPDRAPVWNRTYGDPRQTLITVPFARGLALAAHPAGGVVVGGNFAGQLRTSTGSGGSALLTSAGGCTSGIGDCEADAFVLRLDAAGERVFAVRFGAFGRDSVRTVAVDPTSGDVIAAGTFQGTVDFGGGGLVSEGDTDLFVARLDPATGAHKGSFRIGGRGAEVLGGLALLPDGDVVVAGSFAGMLTIGATTLTAKGDHDAFAARLSPAGTVRWAKGFGSTKESSVRAIAADASGNIVLAGAFERAIDLGGDKNGVRLDDVFVTKLDGQGTVVWAHTWGGDANEQASALAVDSAGGVILAGQTDSIDGVDFGGGSIGGGTRAAAFVVDLDAAGGHRCSRVFPVTPLSPPDGSVVSWGLATAEAAVAVGATGFAIAGSFGGAIDFGKGPLSARGGLDLYAAELSR